MLDLGRCQFRGHTFHIYTFHISLSKRCILFQIEKRVQLQPQVYIGVPPELQTCHIHKDTGEPMSDEQALVESLQLMVAGNETSSTALAWTFYLLAKHPEYIIQIREEVHQVIGQSSEMPDMKMLHQLEKTLCVVDEAMRLYPSFWMIDRIALEEDDIHGIRVPAGSTLSLYIYGLHRNTDIWENPEQFDPSRFEKKYKKDRHPFAHIPFGGGPRVCIGSNMAVMQILLILIAIIRKYDFSLVSEEDIAIKPMMILRPDGEIRMNFYPVGKESYEERS